MNLYLDPKYIQGGLGVIIMKSFLANMLPHIVIAILYSKKLDMV